MRHRSISRPTLLACALGVAASCAAEGDDDEASSAEAADTDAADTEGPAELRPGECAEPIDVAANLAPLTLRADGTLVDSLGRNVIMRGLNTGGRNKWAPFVPFPIDPEADLDTVRAEAEAFFARMVPWGLDTVRLPFSWEAIEPTRGEYDERYLSRYEALVDVAGETGLRVIVDFHQDVYASPFCGDGFPLWTLGEGDFGPPKHDCPQWFLGYAIDDGVRTAFDRFWADEDDLHAAFLDMWTEVATRFAAHPAVVGFEIINEPGWGSNDDIAAWKTDVLAPFHTKVTEALNDVAPDRLVFFDNPGIDALGVGTITHVRPEGDNLVYAPHLYDSGLISGNEYSGYEPEEPLREYAEFSRNEGMAMLLGEFGYAHDTPEGERWLRNAMDEIDALRVSATLWEYSVSSDQWNEEDLSVVAPDGTEREVLDVYVRPWLRALAGTDPTFTWRDDTLDAAWDADGGVTEVVLPPRALPGGPDGLELTGQDACWTFEDPTGLLRVRAPAGVTVTLHLPAQG